MNAKVFKYADDGQTIVAPYKGIESIGDGFFRYFIPYQYGDEYGIVRQITPETFVLVHIVRVCDYDRMIDRIKEAYSDYLSLWKKEGIWPNTLMIKMNEIVGNDTAPIIEKRERMIAERKEAENQARITREKEAEEKRLSNYQYAVEKQKILSEGGTINWEDINYIIGFSTIELHGRTLGVLNKHIEAFGKRGIVELKRAHIVKGTQAKTRDSLFSTIKELANSELKL